MKFYRLTAALLGAALAAVCALPAHAQSFTGTIAASSVYGNSSGSAAKPQSTKVTNAMLAQAAASSIKCNSSGSLGGVQDCALGAGLNFLTSATLQIEPAYARLWPKPSQSTSPTAPWNAVDPWGDPINCTGTTTQCVNEFNAAYTANGWPARVFCQGTQFPSHAEPIFINASSTIVFPVVQDSQYEVDGTCNFNLAITGAGSGVTIDSGGASIYDHLGKIVYQPTAPNGNTASNPSCAVMLNPTTSTADGFPGLYAGITRIKAPVVAPQVQQNITGAANNGGGLIRLTVASTSGWTTNDTKSIANVGGVPNATGAFQITVVDSTHIDLQNSTFAGSYTSGGTVTGVITAAICANAATGTFIQHTFDFHEINANNLAFYGFLVYGAGATTGFLENHVYINQVHGALQKGVAVGFNSTNQANYNNNQWVINNCEMAIVVGSAVSRCLDTYAPNDKYDLGAMNNAQGGLTSGWVVESGANNVKISYSSISGNSGSAFIDNGTCTSYAGPQGSSLALYGTTSGCTQVVSAAAASGKMTMPAATDTIVGRATSDALTNKTIDGSVIGGTTPAAGSFTTLSASTGFAGVSTNSNAPAGDVGEFVSSNVASGSAVSLTSGTQTNVTSVSLTAGDWDCRGNVFFAPNGSTTTTNEIAGLSTTSATIVASPGNGSNTQTTASFGAGLSQSLTLGTTRFSLSSTTSVFMVALASFGVSTNSAYGFVGCRRVR